jgi:hypothetical protein
MHDVIYKVEIALCNINKDTLQLNLWHFTHFSCGLGRCFMIKIGLFKS